MPRQQLWRLQRTLFRGRWNPFCFRPRTVVGVVTLACQLFASVGMPMPSFKPSQAATGSQRYPCENRGCGCVSAEECWKGDCCCFSIEEKLAWAEANGIEPPRHVRALVESRKQRPSAARAENRCCECAKSCESGPADSTIESASCYGSKSKSEGNNHDSCCTTQSERSCPHCSGGADKPTVKRNSDRPSSIHWILGIFARKCRGIGPDSFGQMVPGIPASDDSAPNSAPTQTSMLRPFIRDDYQSISARPPTPPPRID